MSHSDTSTHPDAASDVLRPDVLRPDVLRPDVLRPGESLAAGRWPLRLWGALVVLCGALFLDALDTSMVGVALPSIRDSWTCPPPRCNGSSAATCSGTAASCCSAAGRDLLGRRRVFLTALAVFAVASLLSGMVDDGRLLIGARFVKGIAAAFTAPAGLSIITTTFAEVPDRNRALSIYTTCGAAASRSVWCCPGC